MFFATHMIGALVSFHVGIYRQSGFWTLMTSVLVFIGLTVVAVIAVAEGKGTVGVVVGCLLFTGYTALITFFLVKQARRENLEAEAAEEYDFWCIDDQPTVEDWLND